MIPADKRPAAVHKRFAPRTRHTAHHVVRSGRNVGGVGALGHGRWSQRHRKRYGANKGVLQAAAFSGYLNLFSAVIDHAGSNGDLLRRYSHQNCLSIEKSHFSTVIPIESLIWVHLCSLCGPRQGDSLKTGLGVF